MGIGGDVFGPSFTGNAFIVAGGTCGLPGAGGASGNSLTPATTNFIFYNNSNSSRAGIAAVALLAAVKDQATGLIALEGRQ